MGLRLPIADGEPLRTLRARLHAVRYTEQAIRERLRIWHLCAIALPEYPIYRDRLARRDDALSLCISLFLLQGDVPRRAAERALGARCAGALTRLGLLFSTGPGVLAASASIYPCTGRYFLADHRFRPVVREGDPRPEQPVMHLGQDSYALANLDLGPPSRGYVLDLCAGSGVHGILAARPGRAVTLVDVNPRAVEIARANAALNGVSARCDLRCASLYDALGASERFDLILANPPFVPSPRSGPDRILFQDGGAAGDSVLEPVLRGLPERLTPRGVAAVVGMFADRPRSGHQALIRKHLGARSRTDVLLLRISSVDPESLAFGMTWRAFDDQFSSYVERYRAWADTLHAARIVRLVYGILVVRRSATYSFREVELPLSRALFGTLRLDAARGRAGQGGPGKGQRPRHRGAQLRGDVLGRLHR